MTTTGLQWGCDRSFKSFNLLSIGKAPNGDRERLCPKPPIFRKCSLLTLRGKCATLEMLCASCSDSIHCINFYSLHRRGNPFINEMEPTLSILHNVDAVWSESVDVGIHILSDSQHSIQLFECL